MAFTIRDAIATWDTKSPLKSYLASFQSFDSSNRDWQRIAQTAVAQAEDQKASNFNRMMDRMKYRDQQDQQKFANDMKRQEFLLRREQMERENDMIAQGINPRTGAPVSGTASATIWPPGMEPTQMTGETGEEEAPLPTGYAPADQNNGSLFPTAPVYQVGDEVPDMTGAGEASEEEAETDRVVPEGVESETTDASGWEPVTFARAAGAAQGTVRSMLEEGQGILSRASQVEANLAAQAAQARSMSLQRGMVPEARQAWADRAAERAQELAKVKSLRTDQAARVEQYAKDTAPVVERAKILEEIQPLSNVLPEKDVERVAKEALSPQASPKALEELKILQEYNSLREANNWLHKSNGIATARNLVEASRRMADPDTELWRIVAGEYDTLEGAIRDARREHSSAKREEKDALEEEIKDLERQRTEMSSDARKFKIVVKAFNDALEKDIKRTEKKDAGIMQQFLKANPLFDPARPRRTQSVAPAATPADDDRVSRGAKKYF